MDKQTELNIISNLPDNISMEELIETLNLIKEIQYRIDHFDRSKTLTTEELKKEILTW